MQTSFTHKYMYIYPSILVVSVFFVLRGKKEKKNMMIIIKITA